MHQTEGKKMLSTSRSPMMDRRSATRLGAAAILTAAFAGTRLASADEPIPDALEAMQRDGRFGKWLDLIDHTGLARYMTGESGRSISFTMFAPTDAALAPYKDLLADLKLNTPFPDTWRVNRLVRDYTLPGLHPLSDWNGKTVLLNGFDGNPVQLNAKNPNSPQIILLVGSMKSKNEIDRKAISAKNAIVFPLSAVDLRMIYSW